MSNSILFVPGLRDSKETLEFYYEASQLVGKSEAYVDFSGVQSVFPKSAVPVAGYIHFLKSQGVDINCQGIVDYLEKVNVCNPSMYSGSGPALDRVWYVDSGKAADILVNGLIFDLSKRVTVQSGVLPALNWMLYEIIDNSLRHSGVESCFVMVQVHKVHRYMAVAIFDLGVGIYNTLRQSKHYTFSDEIEAIKLAVQKNVTKGDGRGYGLFGTYQIVRGNSGQLSIFSNGAGVSFDAENKDYPATHRPVSTMPLGCLVEFELFYDRKTDYIKALEGHRPTIQFFEDLEDESNVMRITVRKIADSTSTRPSAERVRKFAENLLITEKRRIRLDFSGIEFVSSSFADELIGKLVLKHGFVGFYNNYIISGINNDIAGVIDIAIKDRMTSGRTS